LLKASIATTVIGTLLIVIESQQGYKWHHPSKSLGGFYTDEVVFYTGVAITLIGAFGVLFTYKRGDK